MDSSGNESALQAQDGDLARGPRHLPSTMASPELDQFSTPSERGSTRGEAVSDLLLNVRLGNYRVLSTLGQGGFGKVYRAEDVVLGRFAAIKFMHNPKDARYRALFEREGKAIAALSKHPNIVEIYECGEFGDHLYFVLEFVEGNALELLKDHPEGLPLLTALRITAECAEALDAAHRNGILHRDVKPANILIEGASLTAKLTDFGLAKFKESSDFTLDGSVSGSPPYMSPEQANGDKLDQRSDVFSLGVTLYELLSARRPYEASSAHAILKMVRENQRIPLQQRRPDLHAGIIAAVDRAIAHNPSERYQTASEFARALRSLMAQIERHGQAGAVMTPAAAMPKNAPGKAATPGPRQAPRWLLALAGCGALAAVALAAFLQGTSREPGVSPAAVQTASAAPLSLLHGGRFAEASAAFQAALATTPDSDALLAGQAMAQIKLGELDDAARTLENCASGDDCGASRAWLAYAQEGSVPPGIKPPLLVEAKIAAEQGDFSSVVRLLEGQAFASVWEQSEAEMLLGTAHMNLGDTGRARSAFEKVADYERSPRAVAQAYLAQITQGESAERSAETLAAAHRIREILDGNQAESAPEDRWTSRPLTFFVLPAEQVSGRFGMETGLPAVLPQLLEDALTDISPMRPVDRQLLDELLREQEISAALSSPAGKVALGQVLGARLVVQCRFSALGRSEHISVRADDTETTARQRVQDIEVQAGRSDPMAVVAALASSIWTGIGTAYPLRGRVYREGDDAYINIGTNVGLQADAVFEALQDPDDPPMADVSIRVTGPVGAGRASVTLTGAQMSDLPEDPALGWFAQEAAQ